MTQKIIIAIIVKFFFFFGAEIIVKYMVLNYLDFEYCTSALENAIQKL